MARLTQSSGLTILRCGALADYKVDKTIVLGPPLICRLPLKPATHGSERPANVRRDGNSSRG